LNFILCLFMVLFTVTSCEKEGPMGPAGPKGETGEGVPGPKGEKGDTGGFTFKEFMFDRITVPAGIGKTALLNFQVSKEEFENSLTLLYVSAGTNNANWYLMPGIASGGKHVYRLWYAFVEENTVSRAILSRTEGPADEAQTFMQARIVVIPLKTVEEMQAAGINTDNRQAIISALKLR